jgi:hypothetical protein
VVHLPGDKRCANTSRASNSGEKSDRGQDDYHAESWQRYLQTGLQENGESQKRTTNEGSTLFSKSLSKKHYFLMFLEIIVSIEGFY